MTIADLFRKPSLSDKARTAVLYQLANAHDAFSEREQLDRLRGHDIEAEGAHAYALLVLEMYRAELDDPAPRMDLPTYADACPGCGGLGSTRIRTGNGGQRVPCAECGGSGLQRPGPRRDA